MTPIRAAVLGGGGREDAVGQAFAASLSCEKVYMIPGNGGTRRFGEQVALDLTDFKSVGDFLEKERIGLAFVGPDQLLADGIVDNLEMRGIPTVGSRRDAARLESSKAYGKMFMRMNGIKTAPFEVFSNYDKALRYLIARGAPIVIKASGLALGKGSHVCMTLAEAEKILYEIMVSPKIHGAAGETVVIEEFLTPCGVGEFSAHALIDIHGNFTEFPFCSDHKRLGEGDTGPMTGGTGIVLRADVPPEGQRHARDVINSTIIGMQKRRRPYEGLLYPGFMQTCDGYMLLEYNVRGGDPEMQAYMRALSSDPVALFYASAQGDLKRLKVSWSLDYVVVVVLMSRGYPGKPDTGHPITGIDSAERIPGVVVYHAGTKWVDGTLVNSGGRVLNVTARAPTLAEAIARAYAAAQCIKFEGMYYRRDIGKKAFMAAQ